jgi:hypothetical protein
MSNAHDDFVPYEQNDSPPATVLFFIAIATLATFFTFIYNVSP